MTIQSSKTPPTGRPSDSKNTEALRWTVGAISGTGQVREENQDVISASYTPLGDLYLVADGMGGHENGRLAAELTVKEIERVFSSEKAGSDPTRALRAAIEAANSAVYSTSQRDADSVMGMGSTALALLVDGAIAHIAHVGDSRAYRHRRGRLVLLTKDHTKVQSLVDRNIVPEEMADDHPEASVLERAIGHTPHVHSDIHPNVQVEPGDAYLLCSDGLSAFVKHEDLEQTLNDNADPRQAAERLFELAMQAGGEDNISVQVVQYGSRTSSAPASPAKAGPAPPAKVTRTRSQSLASIVTAVLLIGLASALGLMWVMLQDAKTSSREQADQLTAELESTQRKLTELESSRNAGSAELASVRDKLNEQTDSQAARVSELEAQLEQAKTQEAQVRDQLAAATKEAERHKAQLEKLNVTMTDSKRRVEELRARVRELEKKNSSLRSELLQNDTSP